MMNDDPKSKGYLPKTSAVALALQKVEKGALNISLDFSLLKISLNSSSQKQFNGKELFAEPPAVKN